MHGRAGEVVAAVSVAAVASRVDSELEERILASVRRAAAHITERLDIVDL